MSDHNSRLGARSSAYSTYRHVRRVEGPGRFFPLGLLPLLGLFALLWVGTTMNGKLFAKVNCPVCQTAVTTPAITTPTVTSTPTQTATPTGFWPAWQYRLSDGVLSLDGSVPNYETRDAIVTAARGLINPPRVSTVSDSMTVTNTAAPQGYLPVAMRGLNTITRCDRGSSAFNENRFSLSCDLPQTEVSAVRAQASAPLPLGTLGSIELLSNEAVASCEESLASLLSAARIEFNTGSAEITAASSALLDRVADAAASCPGTLRIEGHTDNQGGFQINEELSLRRAEAVRSALVFRGLSAARLVAAGYGPSRPVAENTSPSGRARNRRIEIKVVRTSD